MKIAVTYENGQVFQHFGHTERFKIYEVEDGAVTASQVVDTAGSGHGALAGFLRERGVQTLICGGIGGGARTALAQAEIQLYPGVSGAADQAVADLLAGRLAYDPYLPAHVFEEQQATSMGIDELLKVSDFVTIHMPLTPETKDLFNAKSLAEMKDDAVVLNMARGGIVNEQDMYEALKAGKIGGYASDVMENELAGGGLTEGAGFDSPLFECENFLVSPHLGAQSTDASRDIGAHIIAKVKEALNLG